MVDLSNIHPRKIEKPVAVSKNCNRKVVVAFTSWKMRIDYVASLLMCVLRNTVQPDIVFLSLSTQEFPNMEQDLPGKILDIVSVSHGKVRINWVDGPNTKPWKKVFPILEYLDDDDLILLLDDDVEVQNNLIETRVREFDENCGRFAITGGKRYKTHQNIDLMGIRKFNIFCPTTICSKKMLAGWEKFLTQDMIQTYHDDFLYSMLCLLNGFDIVPSDAMSVERNPIIEKEHGMHQSGICSSDSVAMDVFKKAYENATGNCMKDGFSTIVIWDAFDIAGDNGEYFYRKARSLYPWLNMVFLLSRNCPDWDRLKKDGFNLYPFEGDNVRWLIDNSRFILWSKNIQSQGIKTNIDDVLGNNIEKSVFMQHGTTSSISTAVWYFQKFLNKLAKYILVSSEDERNVVSSNSGNIITPLMLGFPRRDCLLEKNTIRKNSSFRGEGGEEEDQPLKVFITFHWRTGDLFSSEDSFTKSDYFNAVNSFLNSEHVRKLSKNGVKFMFMPHAMIRKWGNRFNIPDCIEVPTGKPFQDILVESDVLVTDFSSNSFEMAYMDKPTVCWIPDVQYVRGKCYLQYHIDEISKYSHIIRCVDMNTCFKTISDMKKLHDSGLPLCSIHSGIVKNHDMDNTKRLVEWMFGDNLKW